MSNPIVDDATQTPLQRATLIALPAYYEATKLLRTAKERRVLRDILVSALFRDAEADAQLEMAA